MLSFPSADVLRWPSGMDLPPGPPEGTIFGEYYKFFMDIRVPITIASIYASFVYVSNRIRKTNKTPLKICGTSAFKGLVLAHNIGLSVYSAWTFGGMCLALYRGFSISFGDPAFRSFSGCFWRAFCDMESGVWGQGLAYYGYLFYLSKFYEVFDTIIILAKGRQSSHLQTYHHSGAMMCMWAGIRFNTPPIWVFVVFNSLIHTIMYFYYTLSALQVPIPRVLKQALTTIQITQFLVGGSLAASHMFVSYWNQNKGEYCACVDDPGKFYGLLLNLVYLAPLTYLFVKFWVSSYVLKTQPKGASSRVKTKS